MLKYIFDIPYAPEKNEYVLDGVLSSHLQENLRHLGFGFYIDRYLIANNNAINHLDPSRKLSLMYEPGKIRMPLHNVLSVYTTENRHNPKQMVFIDELVVCMLGDLSAEELAGLGFLNNDELFRRIISKDMTKDSPVSLYKYRKPIVISKASETAKHRM